MAAASESTAVLVREETRIHGSPTRGKGRSLRFNTACRWGQARVAFTRRVLGAGRVSPSKIVQNSLSLTVVKLLATSIGTKTLDGSITSKYFLADHASLLNNVSLFPCHILTLDFRVGPRGDISSSAHSGVAKILACLSRIWSLTWRHQASKSRGHLVPARELHSQHAGNNHPHNVVTYGGNGPPYPQAPRSRRTKPLSGGYGIGGGLYASPGQA
jgi:hypothetical protein